MPSTLITPPATRDLNATLHLLSEHTRLMRPRHDLAPEAQVLARADQANGADSAWFELHPFTHLARAQAASAWGMPRITIEATQAPERADRLRLQGLLLGWHGALFTLGAGGTLAALRHALTTQDPHGAPHALGPVLIWALGTALLTPLVSTQLAAHSYGAALWGLARVASPSQGQAQRAKTAGCCGVLVSVGLSMLVAVLWARPHPDREPHACWAAQVGALALMAGLPATAVLGFDGGRLAAHGAMRHETLFTADDEPSQRTGR